MLLECAAVFSSYIDRTNICVGAIALQAQLSCAGTRKGFVLSDAAPFLLSAAVALFGVLILGLFASVIARMA